MAFIPVPNTVMAELRMLWDSQKVENTLYFAFASAPTILAMTTLANELEGWWVDNYAPLCSAQVTLREISITDLTSANGPLVAIPSAGNPAGANASAALPNNVSLAVSFRTALRGRSFRGRNYFVGLCDSQVVGNTVEPTTVVAIQDCYEAVFPVQAAANCQWVVVSRFANNAPRATGIPTPVAAVTITDNTVDSMRGRLPGRGQ